MLSDLLKIIEARVRAIMNRQSVSEQKILDAIRGASDRSDQNLAALLAYAERHTELLQKILAAVTLPPAVRAELVFEVEGRREQGEKISMKVEQGKKGTLSVVLTNAAGGPGIVDGVPTWSESVPGVVTLTPAADGLSCEVETLPVPAGTPAQTVVISFDGDGDLGDGKKDIIASLALTVYDPAAGAVIADITAGNFA